MQTFLLLCVARCSNYVHIGASYYLILFTSNVKLKTQILALLQGYLLQNYLAFNKYVLQPIFKYTCVYSGAYSILLKTNPRCIQYNIYSSQCNSFWPLKVKQMGSYTMWVHLRFHDCCVQMIFSIVTTFIPFSYYIWHNLSSTTIKSMPFFWIFIFSFTMMLGGLLKSCSSNSFSFNVFPRLELSTTHPIQWITCTCVHTSLNLNYEWKIAIISYFSCISSTILSHSFILPLSPLVLFCLCELLATSHLMNIGFQGAQTSLGIQNYLLQQSP